MTPQQAAEVIQTSGGKIVSLEFTKRTNGETRRMLCRTGVHKHLKGGDLAFDPKEKNLLIVFDMGKWQYRSIPIDGIQRILVKGEWHKVH